MSSRFDANGESVAVTALAALAQESRLRIFRLLVGATPGGLHPGMIAESLDMPANLLSFHLKELQQSGLIASTREGKFMRYRADLDAMRGLVDFLTAHCCEGRPCAGMPVVECRAEAPPALRQAATSSSGRQVQGRSRRSN
jgi:DNA-binding transcriptional ArsR family regulator